jgi:hypothetical protein
MMESAYDQGRLAQRDGESTKTQVASNIREFVKIMRKKDRTKK